MPKPKRKPKRRVVKRRCRTLIDKRTRMRRKVCKPAARKRPSLTDKTPPPRRTPGPAPIAPLVVGRPGQPAPSPAAPPATTGDKPADKPSDKPSDKPREEPKPPPPPPEGLPRQATFGAREAERLLWRAGFGPRPAAPGRPADIAALAGKSVEEAVYSLTRPTVDEAYEGDAPVDAFGHPYTPQRAIAEYGGDVIWWFDRMVRTTRPLAQRMALIWHDWFAVADRQTVGSRRMLKQYELFHGSWLGNFRRLALDVTVDEAMLVFLNGLDNERSAPNENYARELMELFTLGADRGAYTEEDVRELARVLTGYFATWNPQKMDLDGFGFVAARHDPGTKRLWAGTAHERAGTFGWKSVAGTWECDAVDLCLENPLHPSFFVRKLWSYFIAGDPSPATQAALEKLYVSGGYEVRPVVEAILMHPDLYAPDRRLVKPPAVYIAGLFRALGRTIRHFGLDGLLENAGQRPFNPPDVAGWRDQAWLDTNTLLGRAEAIETLVTGHDVPVNDQYPRTETAEEALDKALAFWDRPTLTAGTRDALLAFARTCVDDSMLTPTDRSRWRAQRVNALRYLIALSPDHQTC